MVPTAITIHCTATPNGRFVSPEAIDRAHKKRGFRKAGYHFLIQPNGRVEEGHPLRKINELGAHVKSANKLDGGINIGIALCGLDKYPKVQLSALFELVHKLVDRYEIPPYQIYCHREFASAKIQKKTCPNIRPVDLVIWLFNADARAIDKYILR